ncbi:MAG: hypothetical protein U0792_22595 [Gemmataceae bacterium]
MEHPDDGSHSRRGRRSAIALGIRADAPKAEKAEPKRVPWTTSKITGSPGAATEIQVGAGMAGQVVYEGTPDHALPWK